MKYSNYISLEYLHVSLFSCVQMANFYTSSMLTNRCDQITAEFQLAGCFVFEHWGEDQNKQ